MNCKICHKEDPEHLMRSLIGSVATDSFLCTSCIKRISGGIAPLALIGEEVVVEDDDAPRIEEEKVKEMLNVHCSGCNTTLEEISVTGRFGCEQCYVIYSDIIATADAKIEEKEKRIKEVIKTKYEKGVPTKENILQILKNRMATATKIEDYEEAARVRDKIKKLEKGEDNG